jgi:hypothetical protein
MVVGHEGLVNMDMGIHAYGRYAWAWSMSSPLRIGFSNIEFTLNTLFTILFLAFGDDVSFF